jgi:UrcA family protein
MKALVMLAAVATSALLLFPTVATAQTVTTATVPHQDLNLTAAVDRDKLHARLDRTIAQLCAEPGMRGVSRMAMERPCVASAKASLASFHIALNGRAHSPRG